jgi:hypothetical protein
MSGESGNVSLDDIADLVGWDAAVALSGRFGGTRLYLPRAPRDGSQIALVVGLDPARQIGEAFGGEYLRVPLRVGKHARILALHRQGKSVRLIALELNCADRTVERVLAAGTAADIVDTGRGPKDDPRQLDMFA